MKSIQHMDKLINEFKSLRQMQKAYFKTRDIDVLKKCKVQERKVDDLIDQYFKEGQYQQKLW